MLRVNPENMRILSKAELEGTQLVVLERVGPGLEQHEFRLVRPHALEPAGQCFEVRRVIPSTKQKACRTNALQLVDQPNSFIEP